MKPINELHNIFAKAIESIDWQKHEPLGLYEPIYYTLCSGGKRIRPMLVLLGRELYCNANDNTLTPAINAALAIEMFHNFTLMHDDVMDNADLRRGRPTVHKKWNDNVAILSGDELLIQAYTYLAKLPESKLKKCMQYFNKMATDICEGQQYDMEFETEQNVTVDNYINMIKLKTSVLLGSALMIGAYLADAPENDIQLLKEYGTNLGIAFQIQDDNLDVYGDVNVFGKKIGGDILCNKKTFLLLSAFERSNLQQKNALNYLLNTPNISHEEKITKVKEIYDEIGVKDIALGKMNYYTDLAVQDVKQTTLSDEKQEVLIGLAHQLLSRQS